MIDEFFNFYFIRNLAVSVVALPSSSRVECTIFRSSRKFHSLSNFRRIRRYPFSGVYEVYNFSQYFKWSAPFFLVRHPLFLELRNISTVVKILMILDNKPIDSRAGTSILVVPYCLQNYR